MIPIIYCGNKKALEGIFLSALSIAKRTEEAIKVYVFTMNMSSVKESFVPIEREDVLLLEKGIKKYNKENGVVCIDLTERFKKDFSGSKNLKSSYTPYALLRLYMDDKELIPYDKAVYLDMDTMACRDIKELWDVDISEYEYGAVLDYMGKFWVKPDYCNSGVLYINLNKIRETGLFSRARKYVYENRMFMPDQTAIYRLTTKKLIMDGKFNEQREIKPETVIKHFNKGIIWFPFHIYNIKQWDREKVHNKLKINKFDEDYAEYDEIVGNKTEKSE